jgi:hypothetical protein
MMYHMKRRDVLVLFPQQEEQSVKEFGELRDVVPPARLGHPKAFRRVINGLTAEAVVSQPAALEILEETKDQCIARE